MSKPSSTPQRGRIRRALAVIALAHAVSLLTHCGDDDASEHPTVEGGSGPTTSGGATHASGGDGGAGTTASSGGSGAQEAGSGGLAGAAPSQGGSLANGGQSSPPPSGGAGGEPASSGGSTEQPAAGGEAGSGEAGATLFARPDFILGADISSVQEAVDLGATYVDTDGQVKPIAAILLAHGFNYVRLRTFVEPMNLYGYANPNGDPAYVRTEAYCDRDHTVAFAKQLKDAGLKLLLDLHYSDNWADPGKQVIPQRWRDVTTIDDLAQRVETYTHDVVQSLIDAGAAPEIVQLGNEITPGMLIHIPATNPQADEWGNMNKLVNPINGSTSNWLNLAALLKKAAAGVHAADPSIRIMLHIENTSSANGVLSWIGSVRRQGVAFDILGLSCYTTWQGPPSVWENTFTTVNRSYPDLRFVIAEYGPEARRANEIMRDLPNQRGLGTFYWEPTLSGVGGASLFTRDGDIYNARQDSFSVFDGIRADFGLASSATTAAAGAPGTAGAAAQ